ncbi:TPA: type 1 fimbrial protein [Enterobacter kobei]|uniref:fimbrial protein n=1 Tax=Enterobacter kobei TaxID=208224 RepID=UPI0032AF3D1E|nr:type 1 fimbrial protein [Enterobacter kobei]HDC4552112.1 type 1 fimbrial protein [Enterobacter kobei]
MKKIVLITAIASILGTAGMAHAASNGTITFNGELTANTCDVAIGGQSADATVVLPTIGTNQLDAAAKTAGETGFVIALNGCSGVLKTASAFFEPGASVDPVTGRLKNIGGTASNVSLQLVDASSSSRTVIQAGNQNQVTSTTYKDMSSGSVNLPYNVRYYAEGPVSAGTVVTNVVYSIQYQ